MALEKPYPAHCIASIAWKCISKLGSCSEKYKRSWTGTPACCKICRKRFFSCLTNGRLLSSAQHLSMPHILV